MNFFSRGRKSNEENPADPPGRAGGGHRPPGPNDVQLENKAHNI